MSAATREEAPRFEFGRNWRRFLHDLTEDRVVAAERSLCQMLGTKTLVGRRFLDVGSGSGLFSLAARRLGAVVHSFDFDPESVACTQTLKRRYFPDDAKWTIETGSILDDGYVCGLGAFDVVYAWGVLHHTGNLPRALQNVGRLVAPGGFLFIAIYNDQGPISRYWLAVKRVYNRTPSTRWLLVLLHSPYLVGLRWAARAASGRVLERGMSLWHDTIDWLGGYPFEVARPGAIVQVFAPRGFTLQTLKTCGGRMGCNEFVFQLQRRESPSDSA